LLHLVETYVAQDDASYRSVVEGGPASRKGYETASGAFLPDEDALHHSTVWRTLSWLGSLDTPLQSAMDLILHHDPTSTIHRFAGAVAADKFRSSKREQCLRTARHLLMAMHEFQQVVGRRFFPRFATAAGGG